MSDNSEKFVSGSDESQLQVLGEFIDELLSVLLGGCDHAECDEQVAKPVGEPVEPVGVGEGVKSFGKFRVGALWTPLDEQVARVSLRVLFMDEWHPLCEDLTLLREYSGSRGDVEAPSLVLIGALKRVLQAGGVQVLHMGKEERKTLDGSAVESYTYWVTLGAEHSVAVVNHAMEGSRSGDRFLRFEVTAP